MCIFTAATVAAAGSTAAAASTAATMANVGMALSAAQGVMQYQAGRSAASASRKAYAQSAASTTSAARRTMDRARKVQSEEQIKMAEEIQTVIRDVRKKQALLFTSALESGVTGQSIQQNLDDFERQGVEFTVASRRNFGNFSDRIEDQLHETQIGARDKVDAMRYQVKAPPSFAAAALQIGAGALNAFNNSGIAETRAAASAAGLDDPITNRLI